LHGNTVTSNGIVWFLRNDRSLNTDNKGLSKFVIKTEREREREREKEREREREEREEREREERERRDRRRETNCHLFSSKFNLCKRS
jgi:hypothetical protein